MKNQRKTARVDVLLGFLLAYGMASLVHHVHNAIYLYEYPNLPAWLTPAGVYAAWSGITAAGIIGYVLVRRGYALAGLVLVGVYGALGFGGLAHYRFAFPSQHTFTMNLTIWLEAATGAALLVAVTVLMTVRLRRASTVVRGA